MALQMTTELRPLVGMAPPMLPATNSSSSPLLQAGQEGEGNRFGKCEAARVVDNDRALRSGEVFGLCESCMD